MVRETSKDFLRIDIGHGNIRKIISACQNETVNRTIHFMIAADGKPLDLTNLFYAEILIHRVDGTETDNPCIIDGNDIQYTLRSNDISVIGENEAHLYLTFKDGTTLETPAFWINVFNTLYNPEALQSQNEYNTIVQQALNASLSAENAAESATDAAASATSAEAAASSASSYAEVCEAYKDAAKDSADDAATYASQASTDEALAAAHAEAAAASETAVLAYKNAAASSATAAANSASSASQSASNAAASAASIEGDVSTCQAAAQSASNSADSALESATTATQKATAASNSADAAADSASLATQKATAASNSADSASTSATTATQKATAASNSAEAAASSASTATTKATAASDSASAASSSASTASDKASAATTSATNASDSAEAASTSAAAAAASAAAAAESARQASAGGLELGETSTTAYRGDRGKAAYDHSQSTGNPHSTTAAQVGADPEGSAAAAYTQAAGYVDQQIAALINGAPQTLDTLKEIADAMASQQSVVEALQAAIGSKAAEVDFTNHANNTTIHITSTERTNWNSAYGKVAEVDALHRQIFAHCTTAAATKTKVITLDDNVTLKNNDILNITFQYTNTYNATSSDHVVFSIGGVTYNVATYQDPSNGNYTYPTGTAWTAYGSAKLVVYYKVDVTNHVLLHLGHSIDSNTAWCPQAIGIGHGTCSTAAATAAKTAAMSNYVLVSGGLVAIKFTYAVPASATLSINSKTAKAIYYRGAAITANVIEAGDEALFIYDGSHYVLLACDSWLGKIKSLETRVTALEGKIGYPIAPSNS